MKVFFILFFVVVFYYFGKVVLSHIDSDGTVIGGGSCDNRDGLAILQKAGVFGDLHVKCADEEDEADEAKDLDEESEPASKKKSSWRK